MNENQGLVLDHRTADDFPVKGGAADPEGHRADALRFYRQAIRKAPFRIRAYTRWVRALTAWA